jgi:tetratricopeptide (TPR) repeat protein
MKKSGIFIVPLLIFAVISLLGTKLFAAGTISPAMLVALGAGAMLLMALIRPKAPKGNVTPDTAMTLMGDFSRDAFAQDEKLRRQFDSAVTDYMGAMPKSATGKLEKLQPLCKTDADTYAVSVILGLTKASIGDYEAAIKLYNKAIVLNPTTDLALAIGAAQQRIGELEKARDSYDFALDLDPNNIEALSAKATAYVGDGMFEEAITEARLALEMDENHPSSLATCAICYGILDDMLLHKSYTDKAVDNGYSAVKISDTVTALKKKFKR